MIYRLGPGATATAGKLDELFGTFCGPAAAVEIRSSTSLTGAVYADTVELGANAKLTSAPAAPADLQ